jgi:PTS system nitrogen regulatory IIA component
MNISDLLQPDAVFASLKVQSKKQLLQEVAARAAAQTGVAERKIFETLTERERLGSTGVGEGVAIPHGKIIGGRKLTGIFARSLRGANFEALDGGLTHLFFVLLAPEDAAADHLKALARISRLLKDGAFRARLMQGKTAEEIFKVIKDEDDKF